jgi:hypothetical protein
VNTNPASTRLAKIKRFSQEIGVPYTTVRDAALRGEFPLVRIGRALYVERRDGDKWIQALKQRQP